MTPWNISASDESDRIIDAGLSLAMVPRQVHSFELDDDLVKVVTIWSEGAKCHVNVRYGRDVLLHEESHVFDVGSPVAVQKTEFGVILRTTRRGFPWPGRKFVRKF